MIERRIYNQSALDAREEMLLVPVAVGATDITEGFARQVLDVYPLAEERLKTRRGLNESEIMMVGTMGGDARWLPLYTLVFAAIHHRQEKGWQRAPEMLNDVLDNLYERVGTHSRLATAGIPGAGFSGIKGDASPEQVENALDQSPLRVFVYFDHYSGDREKLQYADPPLVDKAQLDTASASGHLDHASLAS